MTSKLTRERIELIANFHRAMTLPPSHAEIEELARMALAAMDSEPVAEITEDLGRLFVKIYYPTTLIAGDKLYRHAQPAPVVPDDVLAALQKVARIRLDLNGFGGDIRGIADCLCDAEEALIEVVNRCAAMLAAAPHDTPALNSLQSVDSVTGGWIPVSERMPEVGDIVLTAMGGAVNVGEMECSAANCRFFTSVISGREQPATHWMPLPAGPKEDINALIPLVSRNEQEVR